MTPKFIPYQERHGSQAASLADLHDRLGEAVARLPNEALPRDRPSFGCSFHDIPPCPYVDMSAVERLEDIAAEARDEMGEERWQRLQREWNEPQVEGVGR